MAGFDILNAGYRKAKVMAQRYAFHANAKNKIY